MVFVQYAVDHGPQGIDLGLRFRHAQQRHVGELPFQPVLFHIQKIVGHLEQQPQLVCKGADPGRFRLIAAAPVRAGQTRRPEEGPGLEIVDALQGGKVPRLHIQIQALTRRHLQASFWLGLQT